MSSRRNKRRRQQKEWRDEHPPSEIVREAAILRLVRPEEPSLPIEPESPGLPPPPIESLPEPIGPNAGGGTQESESVLVAAVEPGPTGRLAAINPIPVEPGIYLVSFDGYDKSAHFSAYRAMFTQTDCLGLLSKIPLSDGQTIAFAILLGWKKLFESRGIGHWELCYNDWIRQTPDLMKSGVMFIERLNNELRRHNSPEQLIDMESCQLLHLGALAETIGQIDKAVALYNGWARFADYGQIELKSHSPTLVDIGGALLQFRDGDFKIIRVR